MERKIGEIFEHNNEWYQCIESSNCVECAFNGKSKAVCPPCEELKREDGKEVIFKKLEKVGDLVVKEGRIFQCLNSHYTSCIGCVFKGTTKYCDKDRYLDGPCLNNEIWVEKKQNKENELKQNRKNMEDNKLNLKSFDLEKAKQGKPVCTRDGRKARIICFDLNNDEYPIVAVITNNGKEDELYKYDINGINGTIGILDLMMLPEKKEGWVNVYKGSVYTSVYPRIYKSREEAVSDNTTVNRIDTVKIEWEE